MAELNSREQEPTPKTKEELIKDFKAEKLPRTELVDIEGDVSGINESDLHMARDMALTDFDVQADDNSKYDGDEASMLDLYSRNNTVVERSGSTVKVEIGKQYDFDYENATPREKSEMFDGPGTTRVKNNPIAVFRITGKAGK